MTVGLPLMKSVLLPLAQSALMPLGLTPAISTTDEAIQRQFMDLVQQHW